MNTQQILITQVGRCDCKAPPCGLLFELVKRAREKELLFFTKKKQKKATWKLLNVKSSNRKRSIFRIYLRLFLNKTWTYSVNLLMLGTDTDALRCINNHATNININFENKYNKAELFIVNFKFEDCCRNTTGVKLVLGLGTPCTTCTWS